MAHKRKRNIHRSIERFSSGDKTAHRISKQKSETYCNLLASKAYSCVHYITFTVLSHCCKIFNFISIHNNSGSMTAQLVRQLITDFTIIVPAHQQMNTNFSCDRDEKYNCGIHQMCYSKNTIGTFPIG